MVHDERRKRGGRMGPLRTMYFPSECMRLCATELKTFLRSMRPTTVLEYPDLGCAIDVTRTAPDQLYLARLPPPIETQEVAVAQVPWGPGKTLSRFFLVCPHCAVKTATLYIPWGATGFGCRTCKSVTYPRQRDRLAHLFVAHKKIGVELDRLVNRRLAAKQHLVPPATEAEIDARAEELVSELETIGQKLWAYGGHVGVGSR